MSCPMCMQISEYTDIVYFRYRGVFPISGTMYHLPRLLPPPTALATAQELAGLATAQELAVPAAPATAQELAGRGRAGYTEYVTEWNGKASNPTICDWATKLKGHNLNHKNLLTTVING